MSLDGVVVESDAASLHPRIPRGWYLPIKTIVEWLIAVVLLILLGPVVGILAIVVKLTSPGPAFYSQVRLGRHGRPYFIYKLRTMTNNCEAGTGAVWSFGKDSRVTRVGRWLRDTHLDELPQLWNVLMGKMSLIGPRPERPEIVAFVERALPRYRGRLLVRPGVTGLAQMKLPADTSLESVRRKLAYDLYYIQHIGLWLDIRIAISTAFYFMSSIAEVIADLVLRSHGDNAEQGVSRVEMISTTVDAPAVRST